MELDALVLPWERAQIPATPFYFYSESQLEKLFRAYSACIKTEADSAPIEVHFAMKSNNNLDVLEFFRRQGTGIDIVSGGELKRALRAGFTGQDMVFSGVGKSRDELELALRENVALINVESRGELERLAQLATANGARARIALRVNPDVGIDTHPYIATGLEEHKFGVDFNEAWELYQWASRQPSLEIVGLSLHIGSQILDFEPLRVALNRTIDLAERMQHELKIKIRILDIGGGLGIPYSQPLKLPPFTAYGPVVREAAKKWRALQGEDAVLYTECGRCLVAQAGWLVSRVIGTKNASRKNFVIVDASMTELIRPALYQAEHPMEARPAKKGRTLLYDVVGPVCESSDVLGHDRQMPELSEGDLVIIGAAGAYGSVMASQYNDRPLPVEWWSPVKGSPKPSKLLQASSL